MVRVLAGAAFLLAIILSQPPCSSSNPSSPRPLSLRGLPRMLDLPALREARAGTWKLVGLRGGEEDGVDEEEEEMAVLDDVGIDDADGVEMEFGDLADLDDVEIPPFVLRVTPLNIWRDPA